ncbi:uncharacterized protein EV154DRAFT_561410 [Mucor mucedo]|uniref:uncharacterized protein n=1 Tax=Mucor mucedo TaxID=29922 RepID=UPI00221EBCF4|nr:uncharacterized protein EV154DRAFT_561410 [Mucor mucedo]KAI7893415.1 hypothetical protein EV154DRAFT_561410 [Mucor mucedo]
MRHSSTTLYILAAAGVYGSTHEYEDHEINANASSAGHNHPYVGLPIGTWRITDFNSSRREEICSSQQDFCVNKCENQVRTK